jgi:hypothetical protein
MHFLFFRSLFILHMDVSMKIMRTLISRHKGKFKRIVMNCMLPFLVLQLMSINQNCVVSLKNIATWGLQETF